MRNSRERGSDGIGPESARVTNEFRCRSWHGPAFGQQSPATRSVEKPIDMGVVRKALETAALQNCARTKAGGETGNRLRLDAALRGVDLDPAKSMQP